MKDIKILTITGVSGSGKTTLVRHLLERPDQFRLLMSTTTRQPRESDLPGEYSYVDEAEFRRMQKANLFWHATQFSGNWYGTERGEMQRAIEDRRISLAIIVPDKVKDICSYAPERSQAIFLYGPSVEEQYQRMRSRGDSEEAARRRIADCAQWEDQAKRQGDYYFIEQGTPEEIVAQTMLLLEMPNNRE